MSGDYFGKGGFKVATARKAVLDRLELASGPDGSIWSYDRGVWVRDPAAIPVCLADLLEERYRLEHPKTITSMVLNDPPVRLEDAGDLERVNFSNGMLNLETGELERHRIDHYSTSQLPHDYSSTYAPPRRFLRFLSEVAPGREKLLLELIGYSLLDGNPYQVAAMLSGSGANGKGVFLQLIGAIVGKENQSSVTLRQLSDDRYAPADLLGKLVNIAGDIGGGWIKDSSTFKAITGGDSIRAERKYEHGFSFAPRAFSLFSANEIPRSSDVGYGYMRRWIPVRFPNRFDEQERQTDLLEELVGELDGIIGLAVVALREMRRSGGFDRELVGEELEIFRAEVDPLRVFYGEHLERVPGRFLARTDLLQAYKNWAEDEGYRKLPAGKLYARLEEVYREATGLELDRSAMGGIRGFRDLSIIGAIQTPAEAPL